MNARLIITALLIVTITSVTAQVQNGYIRTVGRPDNKNGERLSGVRVKIGGLHGSVVSGVKGRFEFDLQGGKESYQFVSITVDNYELNEKEVIGRIFPVSKIPQEIVMVSLAEKNKIRREVERQVEARYKDKYDELQAQLASHKIQENEYRKKLLELEAIYERREKLIEDMVDRYSHTDYALLSPVEAKINEYIERGELEKADSVINKLNISRLEADRESLIKDIQSKEKQLKGEKKAKSRIDSTLLIAYKGKVNIFRANFQNDSAAYYYGKIISIDTTNTSMLVEGGWFIHEYLANHKLALHYLELALRQGLAKYGENHISVEKSYNQIGGLYNSLGNDSLALVYYSKALELRKILYGENSPEVANSYNNLGNRYMAKKQFSVASDYLQKALAINKATYGEEHSTVAINYVSIGYVYFLQKRFDEALEYYNKALEIQLKVHGENSREVAITYNNIGGAYSQKKDYRKSMEYFQKALNIRIVVLGENHPQVAGSYNNIGTTYCNLEDYEKALQNLIKSLNINISIYGENHRSVANSYNNIGQVYYSAKDLTKALEYENKSLAIYRQLYGEKHARTAYIQKQVDIIKAAISDKP